ncbi:ComEC/Rec2 family competence protein [Ciceribacter sp. RN22]|uniref:ComEC/Rec2 family competence protein n=1 Tax=Ciceribacter sp. RN22 TaxID=2954932 RepID=UPI002093F902|nr:ComEC/Rec2 family competence protein [Ciceribacter sp. RN22]MCO6178227.1 ComEC family competence protein [Ciceribacter sp. RN22]
MEKIAEDRAGTGAGEGPAIAVAISLDAVVIAEPRSAGALVVRQATGRESVVARIFRAATAISSSGRAAIGREEAFGHIFLFVPVALGVGAVIWFALPLTLPIAAPMLLLAVSTVFAVLSRFGRPAAYRTWSALALCAAGMLLADAEVRRLQTVILDTPVTTQVTGRVLRREAGAGGDWRYLVRVEATAEPAIRRAPEEVVLMTRARHEPFALGERLHGRARLSPPSGPALPGLDDFSFASYFGGIGAVGYFLGAPTRAEGAPATGARAWWEAAEQTLLVVRDDITQRIRRTVPGDAGGFAAAILTGDRRSMSAATTEALRLSGLAHITAISGLHMALAAGIFFVGLRKLLSLSPAIAQSWPIKKIAAMAALAATFLYLMISGSQVSAIRAFLMTAIMLVAVLFDRPAISLRNLALAAIVIVAVWPSQVLGASFQMSFAATAGLIAGYDGWRRGAARQSRYAPDFPGRKILSFLWNFAAGTFVTSLIGGLATAIFAVAHFHRLAPYGLVANLAAMPIISVVVMPAALAAMLLMPFGLDTPFLILAGEGLEIVIVIATTVASWSEGTSFGRFGDWFLPLASTGLLLLTLLHTRLRWIGAAVLAAVIGLAILLPAEDTADLIVSEDGRLAGLPAVDGRTIATNRSKPADFLFSQWQHALARPDHLGPLRSADDPVTEVRATGTDRFSAGQIRTVRETMRRQFEAAIPGRFRCTGKSWCIARLEKGWRVATVEDQALLGVACDVADLVITPRRPPFGVCRSGARMIDAEALRRMGATEFYLGNYDDRDIRQRTAFTTLDRPWQRHRLYDWRTGSFADEQPAKRAPMAQVSDSGG